MAGNRTLTLQRRSWLIAYDVRDPVRLARLGRAAAKAALRLQDSLYVADLSETEREKLSARLARLIDVSVDDLRFYPVPECVFGAWFGPAPETAHPDVFLLGSASATLVSRLRHQNMNKKG